MGFDFNAAAFPFPHESCTSVVLNIFFTCVPHWQSISINCTHHIGRMFVINMVAVISNLSCLTLLMYVPFSAIINFFCVPLNIVVCTHVGTCTPGLKSLCYLIWWPLHFITECSALSTVITQCTYLHNVDYF